MSDELSKLNFEDDFQEILGLSDIDRWKLEKANDLEVLVTMYPVIKPEERFKVRFAWKIYPDKPPLMKFCDMLTGQLDNPKAWPILPGFRPTSLDACVNWCEEGFLLHPEWNNDPLYRWDLRGNVLLKVMRILQNELDTKFQGRFQG